MIRALIFDFDGLIVDTESTELRAWEDVFLEYGCRLEPEAWADCIGRPPGSFDPVEYLASLTATVVDPVDLGNAVRQRARAMAYQQPLLPGVMRWLNDARDLGIATGIVSSSGRHWINSHLQRLGIRNRFAHIVSREDTTAHKPDPAPYRAMAALLEVDPEEAAVLEDSPHGVAAAIAAGMWCVAVPGPVTRQLDFGPATRTIQSLDETTLEDLIGWVERNRADQG